MSLRDSGVCDGGPSPAWWVPGIRAKLAVPFVLVAALVGFAMATEQNRRETSRFHDESRRRAGSLALLLAEQLAPAVALGDQDWTGRLLDAAVLRGELAYCTVVNHQGLVVAAGCSDPGPRGEGLVRLGERPLDGGPRPGPPPFLSEATTDEGEPVLEALAPLRFRSRTVGRPDDLVFDARGAGTSEDVGWLRLGVSLAPGQRLLKAEIDRQRITVLGAIVVGLLLGAVVLRQLLEPLGQIADAATRVARGELGTVPEGSLDEVGRLARSFNHMVERLRRSRRFNDVVGQALPLGLLLLDRNCVILEANSPFRLLVGGRSPQGRRLDDVLATDSVTESCRAVLEGAEARFRAELPDGEAPGVPVRRRILEGLVVPVPEGAAEPDAGALAIVQDVTDAELQRSQTADMERRLLEAGRLASLGQLAAGVAHEFNNILQIVSTYTELALFDVEVPTVRANLERVFSATGRATQIVSRLLAFARYRAARRVSVDLSRVVDETVGLVSFSFGRRGIVLERRDEPTPPARVDPGQVSQVIINLIQNATDAMNPGGGTLTISVRPSHEALPSGPAAEIVVQDTGRGMKPEVAARIFDPFFSTKGVYGTTDDERRLQGTGLGLALSHGFIAEHEGEIRVQSDPGRGTTFVIRLPLASGPPDTEAGSGSLPEPSPPPTLDRHRTARVLLVEDETDILEELAAFLASNGYRVLRACSGADALTLLSSSGPVDVAVTDHLMPGMSGIDLTAELLARRLAGRVLLLTGRLSEDVDLDARRAGAWTCLRKPVRLVDLLAAVDGAAEVSTQRPPGSTNQDAAAPELSAPGSQS